MVKPRLLLVLGDQLTHGVAALRAGDPARDLVVMAEVMGEGTSVPHHPQKIALILAAMRAFAGELRAAAGRWPIRASKIRPIPRPSRPNSFAGRQRRGRTR